MDNFKEIFEIIPETDNRAKVGPRQFVISLIFSLCVMDRGKRTLGTLRRAMMKAVQINLLRGGFWERLATPRLFNFVLSLVELSIQQMGAIALPLIQLQSLLMVLKVKGILVLDSTSISLPDMAGAVFPGPRNNVAPAVIKWHSCFDLLGGKIKWFDLSAGTSHDSNHFLDLKTIVGFLVIFDLGYFDLCLFQAISNIGGYFLSRIKANVVIRIDKVIQGLPNKFVGKHLFSARLPKGKSVIEIMGSFANGLFCFRVIGFWNPIDKTYHWYVTNLTAPAKLIYPLYRLRWAVELLFKMAKSSWRLADITSSDPNIAQTLVLASVVVAIISQPMAYTLALLRHKNEDQLQLPSLQRAGIVMAQASVEIRDFLLTTGTAARSRLRATLKLFTEELFDPNKHRESSMKRVFREAGLSG